MQPLIIDAPNNTMNRLASSDSEAHDWYRFVLSYPAHIVRHYLERFDLGPNSTVLDPFCGTGTTIVEAKKRGIRSVGVESHPMTHFASSVKVDWSPDPKRLLMHAEQIADQVSNQFAKQRISDRAQLSLMDEAAVVEYRQKALESLPDDESKLLLKDSISPLPLHKSLILRSAISDNYEPSLMAHERLAFAKALVFSISNLQFGPEVGVGKPKQDAQVLESWLSNVRAMVGDLEAIQARSSAYPTAQAIRADSRQAIQYLERNSVDGVICSPPYPNEKDYTRTTRLETVLLGFARNKKELQTIKKGLVRSNTRTVYVDDEDDR